MSEPPALRRLAGLLADGRFHSGHTLAATLGVARSTIWNHVQALERAGLEVFKVRGRGYRLAEPLELLDARRILDAMSPARRGRLRQLDVLFSVDSTNGHLDDALGRGAEPPLACLAESQSAGRGRRGRTWVSPLARNLYLSLAWSLAPERRGEGGPSGLSLAVGVAVAETLEALGLESVALKWPNDLLVGDEKLGGILIELSGGARHAVIGIGINVAMPDDLADPIAQPWTDLSRALPRPPGRNALAGALLDRLIVALERYDQGGFAAFRDDWSRRDALAGRAVRVEGGTRGIARGVDEQGALLVEVDGELRTVAGGEVSLRAEVPA